MYNPDTTIMNNIMTDICSEKLIPINTTKLIFNNKKVESFRRISEYSTDTTIKLFIMPKVKGGMGKRARGAAAEGGDKNALDKEAYMAKALRNIRAQVIAIQTDANTRDDALVKSVIDSIEDFIQNINNNPNAFNAAFKHLPIERLQEVSQVIGMKNFDHMMRHVTKAVWHEQLQAIGTRVDHLNTFQYTLLREVTTMGYYASNMSIGGGCDHGGFGQLITNAIAESGFAAGRAAAAAQAGGLGL
jgi:hypothetical protein